MGGQEEAEMSFLVAPTCLTTFLKAVFFLQKKGPQISGSPTCLTTLLKAVCVSRKMAADFWESHMSGYVVQGCFFPQTNGFWEEVKTARRAALNF